MKLNLCGWLWHGYFPTHKTTTNKQITNNLFGNYSKVYSDSLCVIFQVGIKPVDSGNVTLWSTELCFVDKNEKKKKQKRTSNEGLLRFGKYESLKTYPLNYWMLLSMRCIWLSFICLDDHLYNVGNDHAYRQGYWIDIFMLYNCSNFGLIIA